MAPDGAVPTPEESEVIGKILGKPSESRSQEEVAMLLDCLRKLPNQSAQDVDLDAQIQYANTGHGVMTRIGHAGDVESGYIRFITLAEMKKRGLRFLPAQVIKRVLRKYRTAGL
jgi:hypothetical protein